MHKILFYNKFISCLYMFRAPCAHRQEVRIVLYSIWYHHTYRWPSRSQVVYFIYLTCRPVYLYENVSLNSSLEWWGFETKVVEKRHTFLCSLKFFPYIVPFMRKFGKYGRARQVTDAYKTERVRFACWMTKATDTHSEYVIFIVVARQQWLRERYSAWRYTYFACLVTLIWWFLFIKIA